VPIQAGSLYYPSASTILTHLRAPPSPSPAGPGGERVSPLAQIAATLHFPSRRPPPPRRDRGHVGAVTSATIRVCPGHVGRVTVRLFRLKRTGYLVSTAGLHNASARPAAGVKIDLRAVTDSESRLGEQTRRGDSESRLGEQTRIGDSESRLGEQTRRAPNSVLRTEFGLQRLPGSPGNFPPRLLVHPEPEPSEPPTTDSKPPIVILRTTVASHSRKGTVVSRPALGCTPPPGTSTSAHVRSEISDRHGPGVTPLTGCGHDLSHGPAVRVRDAARLGEPVQSRRWRSGSAQPSDPARGCRDRLAGLAANRAAPCSVKPLRAGWSGQISTGGVAGRSFPLRRRQVRPGRR
jgi:hypothetical protein